jgi:hypothetical protein
VSSLAAHLAKAGPIARRGELLRAGFTDRDIRRGLETRIVFRVRHGWYALSGTSETVARAIRVGGTITGVEALRLRGLFLPRPSVIDIRVPHNAAHLRRPSHMRQRLQDGDAVRVRWTEATRAELSSREWLATEDDALNLILRTADRDLAVAACDGLIRYRGWRSARLDRAFARAPLRVREWRHLVDGRADSWGETFVRLWLADAGIAMTPQPEVPGVGRFDGRVAPGVLIEVDGAQHDENWDGEGGSSFERDHLKDVRLAAQGGRSIRITYTMLEKHWDECLDAVRTAIALDRGGRRSPVEN